MAHLLDQVLEKRDELYSIARKHKAEKLWVFGSCARREERPDSDIDLLVKFNDSIGLLEYCGLERELSEAMGRKVDLVKNTVLFKEPRFATRVCAEAIRL